MESPGEQPQNTKIASNESQQGATAFITHQVREDKKNMYENWLKEIASACKSHIGSLDVNVISPIPDLTETYSLIIRFDTPEHLDQWLRSDDCVSFVEKVQPLLGRDEDIFIKSGLDFWFTPEGAKAQLPKRWKQFLVTWSAIYPITLIAQKLVLYSIQLLRIPENFFLNTFLITGIVVWAMVYVVMPRYTRLVQRWLFDIS